MTNDTNSSKNSYNIALPPLRKRQLSPDSQDPDWTPDQEQTHTYQGLAFNRGGGHGGGRGRGRGRGRGGRSQSQSRSLSQSLEDNHQGQSLTDPQTIPQVQFRKRDPKYETSADPLDVMSFVDIDLGQESAISTRRQDKPQDDDRAESGARTQTLFDAMTLQTKVVTIGKGFLL